MHYADKKNEAGNGKKLEKYISNYKMAAAKTTQIPTKADKNNLIAWTSNECANRKQIDYIVVIGNIKTWLNYTKTKCASNINKNIKTSN